jgi:hypothetical protein
MTLAARLFRRTACLALLLCSAGPGIENPLAPLGPIGYWKGDDGDKPAGVADASGNNRNGTYNPGSGTSTNALPALKFPNPSCMTFDGVTGMVSIPDNPSLRITGDLTIAFWKRKTATNKDWVRILGKGNGAQRNYGIWEYPEAENRLKFQMYTQGGGSTLELDTPGPIPINTWAHVVVTVSVNSAAFYLNGALVANGARNGEPGTAPDPLTFGHAGYHGFFAGQLDDVRIYNRALSMSEIVYLAQGNGGPAAPAGLAAKSVAPGKVELTWTASPTPAPAGTATVYVIKRSKTAGGGHAPVASGLPVTSWIDTQVEAGATYAYVITAVNTGGESVASNEITVTVPAK